ncbi:MAG: Gfo/Idh/MocA family oxidoreductase [Lentisphaeria bacterium]
MEKIKYGMVGFGGIAENRVAKEGFACDKSRFQPLDHAELVAVCDMNPARQPAAEALGLKWYSSLDEMLKDEEIKAVYIATNNLSHIPLALQILAKGKHVISEKPIATSSVDAQKAIDLSKKMNLSYTVDHMMVYNAWNQEAAKLVQGGRLGVVNDSCFHMEFAYGYDPAEAATWRCSRVEEMGGPIGDVASHCFYLAEFVFGKKIVKLAAVYYPKIMDIKAEDGAYIKFFFEDGMQGSVKCAFSEKRGGLGGTLSNLGFEVYGDKAALRSYGTVFQLSGHSDEPIKMRLDLDAFQGDVEKISPKTYKNIYQSLIDNHAHSILTNKYLHGEDGKHNLVLCEAAHASASQQGKIIDIAD